MIGGDGRQGRRRGGREASRCRRSDERQQHEECGDHGTRSRDRWAYCPIDMNLVSGVMPRPAKESLYFCEDLLDFHGEDLGDEAADVVFLPLHDGIDDHDVGGVAVHGLAGLEDRPPGGLLLALGLLALGERFLEAAEHELEVGGLVRLDENGDRGGIAVKRQHRRRRRGPARRRARRRAAPRPAPLPSRTTGARPETYRNLEALTSLLAAKDRYSTALRRSMKTAITSLATSMPGRVKRIRPPGSCTRCPARTKGRSARRISPRRRRHSARECGPRSTPSASRSPMKSASSSRVGASRGVALGHRRRPARTRAM